MDLKSRNERTPESDAIEIASVVFHWFDTHPDAYGMDSVRFRAAIDEALEEERWRDADSAMGEIFSNEGTMRPLVAFAAAVLCAVYAFGACESGRTNEAWTYVIDGRECAMLAMNVIPPGERTISFAKLGAAARHAENRAMKREAIQAFLSGSFASKDQAAAHISQKIVPAKFRTVRDWLKGI